MTLVVRRWSLKCGRVVDQGSRRVTHLLRLLRRAPGNIGRALGLNIHPGLFTSTLLNCQGSSRSRFSGNNRPRSASGVQSVYRPITGPRYGRWTPSRRHRKMLSVPTALNNSSEYLPNSGGQSHCQCPQNVTRTVARRTFAPPALAPIAPRSARKPKDAADTIGTIAPIGDMTTISKGNAAPTENVRADVNGSPPSEYGKCIARLARGARW